MKCKVYQSFDDWKNDVNYVELYSVKNVESEGGNAVVIHCAGQSVSIPATFIIDVCTR